MGLWATYKHIQRLKAVEERLETIERALNGLRLDWDDVLDKVRRQLGKISKRAEFIEKHEAAEAEPPHVTPPLGENGVMRHGLSERQRELQQAILRRRAGI